ncbi:DNA (cytosine-5)-methyltransferase 3B-like [Penaeus chinensis]|uniref:DNA (cytosine-5)-methyltransferase 3B-like n=1 Tax=Penaeus chinensis TaxID=139456 RepID=UPI001FB6EDD0|nr:DNA (cytosine-5)-methyltransferase 3B-like [Penaeus chinensis]
MEASSFEGSKEGVTKQSNLLCKLNKEAFVEELSEEQSRSLKITGVWSVAGKEHQNSKDIYINLGNSSETNSSFSGFNEPDYQDKSNETNSSYSEFRNSGYQEKSTGEKSSDSQKSQSCKKTHHLAIIRPTMSVLKREESRKIVRPKKSGTLDPSLVTSADTGRFVWAKIAGYRFWPGVIISHEACGTKPASHDKVWVFWYGDNRVSEVDIGKIRDFGKNFCSEYSNISSSNVLTTAVIECLKECRHRAKLESLPSRKSLLQWAKTFFSESADAWMKLLPKEDTPLTARTEQTLKRIRKTQLREYASGSSSNGSLSVSSSSYESDQSSDLEAVRKLREKASLIREVHSGTRDIETICIACDNVNAVVSVPHPYFNGGVCEQCKEDVEESTLAVGPDGVRTYCAVCGSPGEIMLCDYPMCNKVYCTGCVELLVNPDAVARILKTDPWHCFLCDPYDPSTHGLIKPRPDWENKVRYIQTEMDPNCQKSQEFEDAPPDISFPKRPIRVLSLFDGIGTGFHVLDKLGIEVEEYYASEIDEAAQNVSETNFGSRITWIGDVTTFTDKQITELCPIDLLIGGSPCNDLSYVNPNRKGLFDPSGTGILFFHFFRAQKVIEAKNSGTHLFWMYENVLNMPREFKKHISLFLQREPAIIDAKHFSAQCRPRCFWGNIPGMYNPIPSHLLKKKFHLNEYLNKIGNREALVDKINCITTNPASLKLGSNVEWPIRMNDHGDTPWLTEIEKIFGFPSHYTDVGNTSLKERQALLGRSWSVPVIEHILQPLTKYYLVKEENAIVDENNKKRNEPREEPDLNKLSVVDAGHEILLNPNTEAENLDKCQIVAEVRIDKVFRPEMENVDFSKNLLYNPRPLIPVSANCPSEGIKRKKKYSKSVLKSKCCGRRESSSDVPKKTKFDGKSEGITATEFVDFSGFGEELNETNVAESDNDPLFILIPKEKTLALLSDSKGISGKTMPPVFARISAAQSASDAGFDADISSEYNGDVLSDQ